MYNVQSTIYNVQCIQCTIYNVHCKLQLVAILVPTSVWG